MDILIDILTTWVQYLHSGTLAANFLRALVPLLIVAWIIAIIPPPQPTRRRPTRPVTVIRTEES